MNCEIRCPHCGAILTEEEAKHIGRQYAGSKTTPKKAASSAANLNGGGRPKGAKNHAPRADKGRKRGPNSRTLNK